VAAAGLGWRYSTVLLRPESAVVYPDRVAAVDTSTVTLADSHLTRQPGTWGLQWDNGHALIGPTVGRTAAGLVRPLLAGRPPAPGTVVVMDASAYLDPAARGLTVELVEVPTALGDAHAWFMPGGSDTWAIMVHGRGASEREALRIMPTLHRLGYPLLAISYRNDVGSPASPDGRYHLGDSEWQDLSAAVEFAVANGARRLVLFGWSMGGAIVGMFLKRSPGAALVDAVVLDSPVLDWRAVLVLQTRNRHLPTVLARVAERITAWRIDADFDELDLLARPPSVRPPTLLLHGAADSTVPVQPARQLAVSAPSLGWPLHYQELRQAEHTAGWNVDPEHYESAVADFLRKYAPAERAPAQRV
jgi:pimeloyl-ACP methyl ester carboxylesterase